MSLHPRIAEIIKSVTLIEQNEQRSVVLSFVLVFILMVAYYMLRPVRDAMASDWSNTEISQLWNIQFFLSLAFVAIYGFAVSRISFKYLVPVVYGFFASSFVGFNFAASLLSDPELVDKGFYLCVSLFSLFNLSVFWSLMAELFSKEQSKRLFAFIYMGASSGAIVGPLLAALIVQFADAMALMLFASVVILIPLPIIFSLQHLQRTEMQGYQLAGNTSAEKIGGNPLAGFKQFFSSPYLVGIAAFILLYTAIGSFAYFEQTNLLRDFDRDQRTQILALLALVVNVLTFALGFFATARLASKWGMPVTLALVPVLLCAALLVLAFAPLLTVLIGLQIARQAGNYGITRPAREMLFTAVSRESRFKAKPVVDVAIYRGGDAIWSSAFALLSDGAGLGIAAMAAIGAGIAAVWAGVGVLLGSAFDRRSQGEDHTATPLKQELP